MALMGGPTFPRLVQALKLKGSDDDGVAVILYDALYSGSMIIGPFVGLSLRNATSTSAVLQILSGVLATTIAIIYCTLLFENCGERDGLEAGSGSCAAAPSEEQ
jgi:hypothetical protein